MSQVIDGADTTLDAMERVPVNPKNRPLNEIKMTHVSTVGSRVHSWPSALQSALIQPARIIWLTLLCLQVTIHANPIADAQIAGR